MFHIVFFDIADKDILRQIQRIQVYFLTLIPYNLLWIFNLYLEQVQLLRATLYCLLSLPYAPSVRLVNIMYTYIQKTWVLTTACSLFTAFHSLGN